MLAEKYSWEAGKIVMFRSLTMQVGSQREHNVEGRKQEAFETLGTTNWPFSAVVHLELEFLQHEA